MPDLGPYSHFILAAYGLSAFTLLALTIWVHRSETYHAKQLALFEKDDEPKP